MQSYDWSALPEERLNPLVSRKMIHGESMTVARLSLKAGAVVPTHSHVNEQISMIESGAVRFVIGGRELLVRGGETVQIPPGVPHSVVAEEDSVAVDIFSPVREDWRRGDDAYLRG
ncbi:MAG: cupin domain-containing protein [Acidobacteria bacterium]|nr:cupin domain-containing protein [Acidobacteriota bacterium]MBI3471340.1 cupin domain-containing protein [Candidatus Solibacter usitatus]